MFRHTQSPNLSSMHLFSEIYCMVCVTIMRVCAIKVKDMICRKGDTQMRGEDKLLGKGSCTEKEKYSMWLTYESY